MGFFSPLALFFAALSLPILVFYMLKLRRPRQVVSSTLLWQQALHDLQANAPWQRLRRRLLLLLQLLALSLLVFGLARPFARSDAGPQIFKSTTVLLDASASMQATDTSPSRFETARAVIGRAIDRMSSGDALTLIAVADLPRLLARQVNDRASLRQALASAEVTSAEADWETALALAASITRGQPGPHTFILVSDGGLGRLTVDPLLDGSVQFVPIGTGAENLSIAALALGEDTRGLQALVRVANSGPERARLQLTLAVDGALFDARALELDPGGERTLTVGALPLDTQSIAARIEPLAGNDWLAVDNIAWATRPPKREGQTALLVTRGNAFLERALTLLPDLDTVTVPVTTPLTGTLLYEPVISPLQSAVALHILDGVVPASLPREGSLLFIAPRASTELFEVTGPMTRTTIVGSNHDSALLDYVDLRDVHIARALRVTAPPWARTIVEAEGGPLLLAGESAGRRIAILTFDLHHSDLPLQIAFPILVSNLAHWLAPGSVVQPIAPGSPLTVQPGTPVTLYGPPGTAGISVVDPLGESYWLEGEGAVPFAETHVPGLYHVEQVAAGLDSEPIPAGQFAVNLFSDLESDIAPQDSLQWVASADGARPVVRGPLSTGQSGQREWWRWAVLAGLAVLLVEWAVDRGRGGLRP